MENKKNLFCSASCVYDSACQFVTTIQEEKWHKSNTWTNCSGDILLKEKEDSYWKVLSVH